jgi:pumilio RNA-binding family
MTLDVKGSVVVQEMLALATEPQRKMIMGQLAENMVMLSVHTNGCRVIQKALEIGDLDDRLLLAYSIPTKKYVECCLDVNANHVMQKLIELLPSQYLQPICDALTLPFTNTVARLSIHCYGCRVVQRILSRCDIAQKGKILDFVVSNVCEMITDQFGNYVVQHALDFGRDSDREKIIVSIAARDIMMLSCNKFASNVVEKAVRLQCECTGVLVDALVDETRDVNDLVNVMRDRYGNYVVRAFLELSSVKYPGVNVIRRVIKDNSNILRKYTYGWHLIERLEKTSNKSVSPTSNHHHHHHQSHGMQNNYYASEEYMRRDSCASTASPSAFTSTNSPLSNRHTMA